MDVEEEVIFPWNLIKETCGIKKYKEMVDEIKIRKERRNEQTRESIYEDGDTRVDDCMALVVFGQ
jgi:hypothetical protein